MKSRSAPKLPEGDFFYLHDNRSERALLASKKQYDWDPSHTRALANARIAHFLRVDPVGTRYTHARLDYYDRALPLPDRLLHERSCFRTKAPSRLAHFDTILDFCSSATYNIVSAQWADAISALEPGKHEFFPHELQFSDRSVLSHFIFRDRQQIDALRPWPAVPHFEEGRLVWRRGANREIVDAGLKGDLVQGCHFVRSNSLNLFVSRALADRLHTLLPPNVMFYPISLFGDGA